MKLLDDEKMKEENVVQNDLEKNKFDRKPSLCDEECVVKMNLKENIVNNDLMQNKNNCPNALTVKTKVKEISRRDDGVINVNLNKEDRKLMRQLTEELAKLRFDCNQNTATEGKEENLKSDRDEAFDKSDPLEGEENHVNSHQSPVDIIAVGVKNIVLDSRLKDGAKQTDNDIVLVAEKIETPGKEANGAKNEDGEEISERESREKRGEENEDLAATHLLSDANSQSNCVSLEFVGRGPLYGIPKHDESEDSDVYAQPKKFIRPMGYCSHMSGGYVQEARQNVQNVPRVDPSSYAEELNVFSANFPREKVYQPGFMSSMSEMNMLPGHPFDSDSSFSQLDWLMNTQPSAYYGAGNEFLSSRDIVGDFDEFPLSQHLTNLDRYGFPEPSSPTGLYVNLQMPVRSPHDQVLSSPGSSPPSCVNSPYNAASLFAADCDVSAMSPSSYLTSSPESGIVSDLTEEAALDLELALEYIEEHRVDENSVKRTPPLPELIEALNTGLDPIGGAVLPSTGRTCPASVGAGKPTTKKVIHRPGKSKRTAQVLSPVIGEDNVLPGMVFPPPGVNINLIPANFQFPCGFIEPSGKGRKQPVSTKPRTIKPKPPAENSTPSTQMSPSNVHVTALPTFTPPLDIQSSSLESAVTSSSDQDQLVKAYRLIAGLPKERLLVQDEDGDTILHLSIVKEEKKLVKALLERYVREDLIDKVVNLANKQHQTPLCLAVFLNQTEIVKMLIERKADVNVQLQRKLNGGLMCYRLIHYVAKRGQKWVPTLSQLLSAKNIDLHAFDSDGCTAMHCAIKDHGETRHGSEKINSKNTIYHLAMHGADLNYQHGLSGKTPLHYAIEKKDSDLVGWFLGLAAYVQSSGAKVPRNGNALEKLMHSVLNAKPSGGISALQLTLNVQMDQEERVRILELLLQYGAEVSQKSCDGRLRQELAKYPKLAQYLKNGISLPKNL